MIDLRTNPQHPALAALVTAFKLAHAGDAAAARAAFLEQLQPAGAEVAELPALNVEDWY